MPIKQGLSPAKKGKTSDRRRRFANGNLAPLVNGVNLEIVFGPDPDGVSGLTAEPAIPQAKLRFRLSYNEAGREWPQ